MPFDGESGEVGADEIFSVHLLRKDRSCFFGEVEVDRGRRKWIVVDDDGEGLGSRSHWGGSGRTTRRGRRSLTSLLVGGPPTGMVDWGSCAPFEGGSPLSSGGGKMSHPRVAGFSQQLLFPLFSFLFQVPSRHV